MAKKVLDGYNHRSNCLFGQTIWQTEERKVMFGMWGVLLSHILITVKVRAAILDPTGVFWYRQLGLSHHLIVVMSPTMYFDCQIDLRTNRFP